MALTVEPQPARRSRGNRQLCWIPLAAVRPNPYQPRKQFSEESIAELASSIQQYGLLSPIAVRRVGQEQYELIAGERRLRALRRLGVTHADAIIMPAFEQDTAIIALIENIQREQLHFFEEAEAYHALLREHSMTQEELAHRLGKSPSAIANKLRVLKLPAAARSILCEHQLTERHARALLRLSGEEEQMRVLRQVAARGLSVAECEKLVERAVIGMEFPPAPEVPRRVVRPIRAAYRDHRIFVNALMDVVKKLRDAGVEVTTDVKLLDDHVCMSIVMPRLFHGQAQSAAGAGLEG